MQTKNTNFLTNSFLAVCSGILIFLSLPSLNWYFLEWFAFVPLLFALKGTSLREGYILGLITGMSTILGAYTWVSHLALHFIGWPWPSNYLAYFLYAFVQGQIFGFVILLFRWGHAKRKIPDWILFPCFLVSLWSFFPMLFGFQLGDGQSYFLEAIQAIEWTGVFGLDFMIGLSNILIYRLFDYKHVPLRLTSLFFCSLLFVFWFGYGFYSLEKWDEKIDSWSTKKVGLVQPNRPASLGRTPPGAGYSWEKPLELEMSAALAKEGALFALWPEGNFRGYSFWESVRKSFHQFAQEKNISLIFHDTTFQTINKKNQYYNSMLWIGPSGKKEGIYHKIRLVPFGEYIPILADFPELKNFLSQWVEGLDYNDLTPGTTSEIFPIDGMRIIPSICYESVFPKLIASSIGEDGKGKVLVILTQDGWYGKSNQPEGHMAITALRAVENRVPLIHSVNNGSSAIVLPQGRYQFRSEEYVTGKWAVDMPFDENSGGSFYSRYPNLILNGIRLFSLIMVLFLWFLPKNKRSRE